MRRRLYLIMLLAAITLSGMAQNVGDALYVFRNDGEFHAFLSDEIESMEYSYEDAEGNVYDEVVTQVITTPDSVYKIPLAVIDSISFVRPETIYREDAIVIPDGLLDYVIAVDGKVLTLSPSTPSSLLPKVGDKLVAFELSEKLPYGFLGQVKSITNRGSGIVLNCEYIKPEDVAKRFYGIYKIGSDNNSSASPIHKAQKTGSYYESFHIGTKTFPMEFSGTIFNKKDVLAFNAKAGGDYTITPDIDVTMTVAVDDFYALSNMSFHIVTDFSSKEDIELVGEMSLEKKIELFTIPVTFPIGIEFYFQGGFKLSGSGELALGVTYTQKGRHVMDIKYYPYSPIFSRVNQNLDISDTSTDWHYFAGRVTNKIGAYAEVGFGIGSHDIAKIGGEFDAGLYCRTEFMFNWDEIEQADESTQLYEALKDVNNVDINAYIGAYFVAGAAKDRLKFSLGTDWELPWKLYQGRLLPTFDDVYATWSSGTSAKAHTSITNDCLLPWKVGFSIFDSNNEFVDRYYNPTLYWNRAVSYHEYEHTFTGLQMGENYTVYPTLDLFGHSVIAIPSAELESEHTVTTLAATNVTENSATLNGQIGLFVPNMKGNVFFYYGTNNNPKTYGTKVNVGSASSLSSADFYINVSGLQPNKTYYYIAGYNDGQNVVYGQVLSFKTQPGLLACPDGNHPHMIDMGLPSGTKWACCNVGASTPEQAGGYYAWGETQTKSEYSFESYLYDYYTVGERVIDILGTDIAGTVYDAATANWGAPWQMPTLDQINELINKTTSVWTSQNGVYGRQYTGSNGGTIFLPAAGVMMDWEMYEYSGLCFPEQGFYWSSTICDYDNSYSLHIRSDKTYSGYGGYEFGNNVRPVCK